MIDPEVIEQITNLLSTVEEIMKDAVEWGEDHGMDLSRFKL